MITSDRERVEEITRAAQRKLNKSSHGFTLIELSIVLVIIGLIVGGVLVGQSLIGAAGVRATISQIEKYNTAANTFRDKYGALPGDIPDPAASSFGFQARGQYRGEGDGNGVLESNYQNSAYSGTTSYGVGAAMGETVVFWVDLSTAHLIDGGFTSATPTTWHGTNLTASTTPTIGQFLPQAKLGSGNYIYVWSGGYSVNANGNGVNYFGLSAITTIGNGVGMLSNPGLSVAQAYQIDTKIDDGLPQTGRVTALYANGYSTYNTGLLAWSGPSDTSATPGSSSTCYDNGGNAGTTQQYSVEMNNGSNVNCGISFRMQAGD